MPSEMITIHVCLPMQQHFCPFLFVNFAAGQKPGFAPVEVFAQDKVYSLGTTRILYLDKEERKKMYQQLVNDKDRQSEFFQEWAALRRDSGRSISSSPVSSSLGNSLSNTFKCWPRNEAKLDFTKVNLKTYRNLYIVCINLYHFSFSFFQSSCVSKLE